MSTISAEERMFQEALSAIESDDKVRAKDLLARLLRIDQKNPEYWLWMSAFVSNNKERRYCLNQVLQYDPKNKDARRGLILLGDLPLDPELMVPYDAQVQKWELPAIPGTERETASNSWLKISFAVVGLVVAITLIVLAIRSDRLFNFRTRNVAVIGTAQPTPTYPPTATFTITPTLEIRGPVAPWMALEATYTPTALYVNTPHPIIEAYRIAMRNYQLENWPQAIQYFTQAIGQDDQSADLYYYLGESYRQSGNLSDAQESFEQAITLDEEFSPAYLGLARIDAVRNPDELDAAIDDLNNAIKYDPSYGEAYLELAQNYLLTENIEGAEETLVQAGELLPESPRIPLLLGKIALAQGNPDEAVALAQQANNKDLYLLDTYKFLGQALQADGKTKESLDPLYIYTQYSNQEDAQAVAWLADAYAANGNFDKAIEIFDEAIAINRFQIDAYLKRGQIYLSQKNYEKAIDDFSMAFKIRPSSYEACIQFGEALLDAGQAGNAYQQISKCQKLAETDTELARMYFLRASSLERLENDVAQRDWERMLELPQEALDPIWVATAQAYLNTYYTATPTLTRTPRPSATMTATATSNLEN